MMITLLLVNVLAHSEIWRLKRGLPVISLACNDKRVVLGRGEVTLGRIHPLRFVIGSLRVVCFLTDALTPLRLLRGQLLR